MAVKKTSKPPKQDLIERRIHFYRVRTKNGPNGTPVIFNPAKTLASVQQLLFNPTGRYLVESSGDALVCLANRANLLTGSFLERLVAGIYRKRKKKETGHL